MYFKKKKRGKVRTPTWTLSQNNSLFVLRVNVQVVEVEVVRNPAPGTYEYIVTFQKPATWERRKQLLGSQNVSYGVGLSAI